MIDPTNTAPLQINTYAPKQVLAVLAVVLILLVTLFVIVKTWKSVPEEIVVIPPPAEEENADAFFTRDVQERYRSIQESFNKGDLSQEEAEALMSALFEEAI